MSPKWHPVGFGGKTGILIHKGAAQSKFYFLLGGSWSKQGNKMRGFSHPLWASVDEIQLGLFVWENSSNWTGRSIYLELPDLFRFIFPASVW